MDTAARKQIARLTMVIGTAQAATWIVLCATTVGFILRFQKIFADFGAELPVSTVVVLSLGNLLYCYWYVALLLICLWPIATKGIVVALWPAPENAVARWSWYLITWLASVVLMAFIVVIILVPLLSLVSALSK